MIVGIVRRQSLSSFLSAVFVMNIINDHDHDDMIIVFLFRHLLDKEELLVVPHLNIGMDR